MTFAAGLRSALAGLLLAWAGAAFALSPEQAARIAAGDSDARIAALNEAVASADPALGAFVQALLADEVKVAGGKAYIERGDKVTEAGSGAATALPPGAEDVVNPNRVRREFEAALAALALFSPERALRDKAITALRDQADEGKLGVIEKALAVEPDADLKARIACVQYQMRRIASFEEFATQVTYFVGVAADYRADFLDRKSVV